MLFIPYNFLSTKYKVHILQVIIYYFHKKIRNIRNNNLFKMGSENPFQSKM